MPFMYISFVCDATSPAAICTLSLHDALPIYLLKRAAVAIALPPLEAMFNAQGTLYAADLKRGPAVARPETRFVLWFNGNGITERYWMPTGTGRDFELTPCLAPLAPYRNDIHVITGLDNP